MRCWRKKVETIKLRDEFIKLGQVLKAAGWVEDGVEAKLPFRTEKYLSTARRIHAADGSYMTEILSVMTAMR